MLTEIEDQKKRAEAELRNAQETARRLNLNAFVSCQDYIGRYYNSYLAMAKEDLDFFVHLGDYVYETTGDPSFQTSGGAPDRKVVFGKREAAIQQWRQLIPKGRVPPRPKEDGSNS